MLLEIHKNTELCCGLCGERKNNCLQKQDYVKNWLYKLKFARLKSQQNFFFNIRKHINGGCCTTNSYKTMQDVDCRCKQRGTAGADLFLGL